MTGPDPQATGRGPDDDTPAEPALPDDSGPPDTSPDAPSRLPPDPVAYDSPRASIARARGLSAPYIAGGRDPDPASGRRQDRFYGRLLIIMVVAIVLAGFVFGIIDNLLTSSGTR